MPRKPDTTKKERYHDPFPSRLRELMDKRGINQETLAQELGLSSRQSVTGYIDGSTLPTIDKIKKIAEFFSVPSDYLLGLSDDPGVTPDAKAAGGYLGLSDFEVRQLQKITRSIRRELFVPMLRDGTLVRVLRAIGVAKAEIDKLYNKLSDENAPETRYHARHILRDLAEDLEKELSEITGRSALEWAIGRIIRTQTDQEEYNDGEHQED